MHILSGKSKCFDRSTSRERERETERERERQRDVFFLNFVIFFNSENSSTCFKVSCISCLALDLAITARAGHFSDSVCKNLAAVEKKNE